MKRIKDGYGIDAGSEEYKDYTINFYYDQDFNPFMDQDVMPTVYNAKGKNSFNFGKRIDVEFYNSDDVAEYFKDYYYIPYCAYFGSQPAVWEEYEHPENADGFLVWKKGEYEEETGSSIDPYESLRNDLELLDTYIKGEIYGYSIDNPEGEEICDPIWGYVGWDGYQEAVAEAKGMIDADIEEQEAIAAEEAAEEEEFERTREDREFDEFWDKRGDIGDSAKNKVSDSFNSDLRDIINVELMGLADGIEVSECNENRVLIETTFKLYSRFKDDIKDIMLDFDYAYNKSYPMKDKWIIDFRG